MTKRAYLIHGWDGSPEDGFKPWLKAELEKREFEVIVPLMPDSARPMPETWLPFLQGLIKDPGLDVTLVGHSMGGQAALRYLESLPEGVVLGKVVLVAPVVDQILDLPPEDEPVRDAWFSLPTDPEKVKRSTKELVGFFSDNDQWIPLSSADTLRDRYGARIIIEHEKGHYSTDTGIHDVPLILEEICRESL